MARYGCLSYLFSRVGLQPLEVAMLFHEIFGGHQSTWRLAGSTGGLNTTMTGLEVLGIIYKGWYLIAHLALYLGHVQALSK